MNNDPWTLIQKILLMIATALGFVCAMGQSLSMIDRYQHEQGQLDKEGKQTQVAPQPRQEDAQNQHSVNRGGTLL